jgi:hypothetical protein
MKRPKRKVDGQTTQFEATETPMVINIDAMFAPGVDFERAQVVADCLHREISLCYDPRHVNRFEALFPSGKRDPEGIELDLSRPWFGMAHCPIEYPSPSAIPMRIGHREPLSWTTEEPHWRRGLQILIDSGRLETRRRSGDILVVALKSPVADKGQANFVPPAGESGKTAHSPDFRSVSWFGECHSFTGKQAECVRVLWKAWEQGTFDVGEKTVLAEAESDTTRLANLFKDHAAFGRMIVRGTTRGTFRLQPRQALPS